MTRLRRAKGKYMRNILSITFFCLLSALYAEDLYQIKNNELYTTNNTVVELGQYDHLGKLSNGKNIKYIARIEKSWNYTFFLFDANGKQVSSLNIGNDYELPWIDLSPKEDFYVLDDGTWIIRSLDVYSFPSSIKMTTLTYKRYYFWMDKYLYYNSISKETIDGYPADDDTYCYVSRFNPYTKEIEVIIKWNECNQYEIKNYSNNIIELENKYVLNKSDWKVSDKWKRRILKFSILDCSFKQAVINDDLVRFRNEPNLSSKKISNFSKNDTINIISRTENMVNVEGSDNYWYLVQDGNGIIGYVFGKYISQK